MSPAGHRLCQLGPCGSSEARYHTVRMDLVGQTLAWHLVLGANAPFLGP